MAKTTFSGPVQSDNGFIGAVAGAVVGSVDASAGTIRIPSALVGALPSAAVAGRILYVSDANTGAGTVCFSDGTNWIDIKTGVAVV